MSDYQGCIIIVSHDRYFMDRLVDHLFVFEGDGVIRDYPGNYSLYRIWMKEQEKLSAGNGQSSGKTTETNYTTVHTSKPVTDTVKKLSYKDKREFETLEAEIAILEKEKTSLTEKLNYSQAAFGELQKLSGRMGEINTLLEKKEMRWLELSEAT